VPPYTSVPVSCVSPAGLTAMVDGSSATAVNAVPMPVERAPRSGPFAKDSECRSRNRMKRMTRKPVVPKLYKEFLVISCQGSVCHSPGVAVLTAQPFGLLYQIPHNNAVICVVLFPHNSIDCLGQLITQKSQVNSQIPVPLRSGNLYTVYSSAPVPFFQANSFCILLVYVPLY